MKNITKLKYLTRAFALPILWVVSQSVSEAQNDIIAVRPSTPRITYGLNAITEGQWNMTHQRGGWANRLDAELSIDLWRGATAEAAVLATYQPTAEVAEVWQDFSNINAPNRPLRLVHLGWQQRLSRKVSLYLGLRQADEDYFCTPLASLSTGASCGCVPTVNDNYHINVFPLTALGLHLSYSPLEALTLQASLYNGNAYDTLDRSFRFRPHRDGVITIGSLTYERPAEADDDFGATYVLGWNFGNHYRSTTQRRHSQAGFWLTAEQPICRLGRVGMALGATVAYEFKDPEVAKGYWSATCALNHLTRKGGTLAFVFNRAHYHGAHESDLEATFVMPLGKYFTLQPALHHYSTSGQRQWLGQLRLSLSL